MTRAISLMIEGWMPSVGSSRTNSRGRVTSARAIASCCCWPPERSPPRRPQHVLQARKQREDLVGDMTQIARQRRKAGREVFRYGQPRKYLAALRHQRQAGARPLVRRQRGQFAILPAMRPARIGCSPKIARNRLVLPTPLRPRMQVTSPFFAVRLTRRSDLACPVIEIDRFDRQHGSATEIDFDHARICSGHDRSSLRPAPRPRAAP